MPAFSTPARTTQRYIPTVDRSTPDAMPGTKKIYADTAAFVQGVTDERACIAQGLPVWYDGMDIQVQSEPTVAKRMWTLATSAGSPNANAAASHGRIVVIGFKKFTLAADENRVLSTTGAPMAGVGANGDLALDETAATVYRKASGAWAVETVFGSVASGSGVTQIAYGTTIPLDGNKVMPRTQIAGAVALSIGAKVAGGQCRIPFVSNGTNAPTVAGAVEWATSFGFDNTQSGVLNVLDVWTDDGTNVAFAWSQQLDAADTIAPTVASASVANASPTVINLAFSETMDPSFTPAASAFAVSAGHTVSSVAWASGVLNVTVTPAFANGEAARTLAYTQPGSNGARDLAGNLLASFSARAIVNNVQPTDTTAPVVGTPTVNGASLVLPYNEALNTTAPAASAYSVSLAGVAQTPTAVAISGQNVTLTLGTPATSGQSATVSYTVPGSNPVRDTAGNSAAAFSALAVTNNTGALQAQTSDYLSRVAANGGTVSTAERNAADAFFAAANADGYLSAWNPRLMVPMGDANAQKVPLLVGGGAALDVWSAGVTYEAAKGWVFNAVTQFVDMTFGPSITGTIGAYLRDTQPSEATQRTLFGVRNSGSQPYRITGNANNLGSVEAGTVYGNYGDNSVVPYASTSGGLTAGLWHLCRTSASLLILLKNAAEVGYITGTVAAASPGRNTYIGASNADGTAAGGLVPGSSVGYAFQGGVINTANAVKFKNSMQTFMTALGRNV